MMMKVGTLQQIDQIDGKSESNTFDVYLQRKCIRVNTFAPLRLTYKTDEIIVWYDSNPKTTESHADM